MCSAGHNLVDLGFAELKLPAGTHICQIYSDDAERDDSLMQFIACGLKAREKAACFSENVTAAKLGEYLAKSGISQDEAIGSGALTKAGTNEVYFANDKFDPDVMLGLLSEFYDKSVAEGYSAARVIGEMSKDIATVAGGSRLIEYESRVSMLLRDHPVTAVCQYNAADFDGATIMDVLKVHPMMVVRGSVIQNPFYISPEEVLAGKK